MLAPHVKAAERVATTRQDNAISKLATRLDQIAAAVEVRFKEHEQTLQAHLKARDAQVSRLVSDLRVERDHGKVLKEQLDQVHTKLAAAAAETERLKEQLEEKLRSDAALRQSLRLTEEASLKARAQESDERRAEMSAVREQVRELAQALSLVQARVEAVSIDASHSLNKAQEAWSQGLGEVQQRIGETGHSLSAQAAELKTDLSQQAASHKAGMAALREAHAAELKRVSEQLGALSQEHTLCRSEDEAKVAMALHSLHTELTASIGTLRSQVSEAIVPLGEPGALSTLREALIRVDGLGEEVEQLCAHMASLKMRDVAGAQDTEARITELERQLTIHALWAGEPTPRPRSPPRVRLSSPGRSPSCYWR